MLDRHSQPTSFIGSWSVVFPATYLVHIAEEFWGGFPQWVAEFSGFAISTDGFLAANAVLWIAMTAAVAWVLHSASSAWVLVALAAVVLVNSVLHVLGTVLTHSYSPGLISAAVLWLPLGLATLARARTLLPPRTFQGGVVAGLVVHALVPAIGLGFVQLLAD